MKLHIAGVCHLDPTGTTRLAEWLEHLLRDKAEFPAFVAVEFDAELFAKVKSQRTVFRSLLSQHWPRATPELLDELALSLGYEGDTHERAFPHAKVIWLDQGRPSDVENLAPARLVTYHQFLGEQGLPHNASAALSRLSQQAWESANAPTEGNDRDRKFASLVLQEIEDAGGDWAIVIVGATHASDRPGRMRRLLEEAGHTCEVTMLRP
jgi:hypothetical protein